MNEEDHVKFLKSLQFIEKRDSVYTIDNYHLDIFPHIHFNWNVRKFITFEYNNILDWKYLSIHSSRSCFEKYLLKSLKR